ncbi:glycerol-3-phosphate acyltransferase PlsY [mine drainage metagenome]|uniref:Glycerol-3-phosphate acyltransferase PlsY n=1 Tax=mine drainage metagenome TaxID=410659 RepID=T1CTD3_9ZZZZ
MPILRVIAALVAAYLLGSILAGPIVARWLGGDLRATGSGNPGATNALRLFGRRAGFLVFGFDFAKGVIAGLWIPLWLAPGALGWLPPFTVLAAVLGHLFPVFSRFRGGKGVATFLGGVLALAPPLFVFVVLAWAIAFYGTGYVAIASLFGALTFAVLAWIWPGSWSPVLLGGFGVLCLLILLWTHRANLKRLRDGVEHRFHTNRHTS